MNTSFETEAELALQHLPNGLVVITKGSVVFNDQLGKTYLTEATGTGITLASGNVAVEQPSASVNEAAIAVNTGNISTNATNIATNTTNIATNTSGLLTKMPYTGGAFTGQITRSGRGGYNHMLNASNTGGAIDVVGAPPAAGQGEPGDIWLVI